MDVLTGFFKESANSTSSTQFKARALKAVGQHRPRGERATTVAKSRVVWIVAAGLFLLASCTPAAPYRTTLPDPPPNCHVSDEGDVSAECGTSRHERTTDYDLLFVEFDDQGLLYPGSQQKKLEQWPRDIDEIMDRLHQLAGGYKEQGISLFLFVHGWKHNASSEDENVRAFRRMLQSAALVEQASQSHHRVIGIYIAWRGLSSTVEPFLELSFWERKATALYVAHGSARGLLTRLKGFQQGINCEVRESCIGGEPKAGTRPKVRFIMIGHSFGGLILFNAISGSLVEGLTYRQDSGDPGAPAVRFGDMVVLLNPAFEASRYTPLHRIVTNPDRPFEKYQAPVLVSITSTADWATGLAFPAGRFINTIFEKAASPEESKAIKNTMGHVPLYITHKLASSDFECAGWNRDVMTADPSIRVSQMRENLRVESENNAKFFGTERAPVLQDHWVRNFCGGAVLTHVNYKPNSPIWNVQTDKSVIKDHGDIAGSILTNFLRQLYKDSYEFPAE